MARKDKYNKNKPQVSPITLIIVGLIFAGIIATIVFSIGGPKKRFNSAYFTKEGKVVENNYKLSSFKKVNKEIEKGKDVVVVINMKEQESSPASLLQSLNDGYFKSKPEFDFEGNVVSEHIKVIYYVEVKTAEVLEDFLELHDEIEVSFPMALAFSEGTFQVQHKKTPKESEIENAPDKDQAIMLRRTEAFFREYSLILDPTLADKE